VRLLDITAAGQYSVQIENLVGARLLETTLRLQPNQDAGLDLHSLPAGVYMLRLQDRSGHTAIRRLVRN
jgi:hypothetical protein